MNKTILSIKSLLHKANSSCGRPLVSLIFGLLILSCSSSTEEINPMESYYIESQGLVRTTIDSTLNFAHKYNHYVFNTPGALSDVHYQPTMSNLCTALDSFGYKLVAWNLNVTITVNDKWEGETEINF